GPAFRPLLGLHSVHAGAPAQPRAYRSGFARGALIALSNPKGLLFYAAVLPQFVDPARPALPQFAVMAGTFASLELVVTSCVAWATRPLAPVLHRASVVRRVQQAGGAILIGAAALIALSPVRP